MGWLDDEDQAESIFGGDDYFSHVFRSGLQSDAFDPDSEEAKSYLELAKTPPPSEAMYGDYMSRRPVLGGADTKPSIGRKLMSAVAAMSDPHNGITLANQINRQPYENAFHNWKTEGANINQQARAADSGRSRELAASKELLNMKGRKAREDRLIAGVDDRRRRADETARLKAEEEKESDKRYEAAEGRRIRLEERGLRNEERAISTQDRANEAAKRSETHLDITKEDKTRELNSLRFERAKEKAHEFVDSKFPDFFTDDKDGNRVLSPKLSENEKKRAIDLIKQQEDVYMRMYGLVK